VSAYYGNQIQYSYYSGCSTGGRQGLKEIQISPGSFDGALIGAPAWYTTHINNWVTKVGTYNFPLTDPKYIPYTIFPVIAAEVVKQCDGVDGVMDGIVSEPEKCNFDYAPIRCGNADIDPEACLTDVQIETAKNIYRDYYSASGEWLYSGLTLSSEAQWWILLADVEPAAVGVGFQKYFVFDDPDWKWEQYNDSVIDYAEMVDPGQATADKYDLSEFKQRGGKLLMYHGLADGLVPTRGSDVYYERVSQAMKNPPQDFFRYFQVPGMQHCWGTVVDAPWNIGAAYQAGVMDPAAWSVPGFRNAQHDALIALTDWVERGKAVESIIATTWNSPQDPSTGVRRQRPLCPYPKKATWDKSGNADLATSWSCV
jgi:feruloyl esterase